MKRLEVEKAEMSIRNLLRGFDRPTRAIILKPIIEEIGEPSESNEVCPLCYQRPGRHCSWCSMASAMRE